MRPEEVVGGEKKKRKEKENRKAWESLKTTRMYDIPYVE